MRFRSQVQPSFGLSAALLLVASALGLAACAKSVSPIGGSGSGDEGEGGAAGGTSTGLGTTGTTTKTGGGGGTGTSTGTATGGACDGTGTCKTCADCAASGPCSTQLDACVADQGCNDFVTCLDPCATGDTACVDACQSKYPAGASLYLDYASCVVCSACYADCDGAGSCS